MKLSLHPLDLQLEHPFTIARGTITHQPSLVVQLEHDGLCGLGEVTESRFYGHTIDSISESLAAIRPLLTNNPNPAADGWPADLWSQADQITDDRFALCALDMAAHDLSARLRGIQLHEAWGLEWVDVPPSSYTIGIAPIDQMVAKLRERPGWSVYKIKLGTANDIEIVRQLRKQTAAAFRVDANGGWSCQQAIDNTVALAPLNVQFVEQPLPLDASAADKQRVFAESKLPVIADEDCQIEDDLHRCQGRFHGINIKLCKCGGLTSALRMIRRARQFGLKTMVGCMIESSVGISAAAHLLPLLDYADLDGATLLSDDPADGVKISLGKVELPDGCGSGARLKCHHSTE